MRRLFVTLVLSTVLVVAAAAQSNEATGEASSSSRPVPSRPAQSRPAQSRPAPSRPTSKAGEDLFGRALTWVRKSTYAMTKGGRTYAENLIRKTPKSFASVRREVEGLGKRVTQNGALRDLDEKRRYVAELWRLRASLDLMALLDARTLEMLTGIDAKTIASLEKSLSGVAKTLGLAPAQTRPAGASPKSGGRG